MRAPIEEAELYLDGIHVGNVIVQGASDAWEYGEFKPAEVFSKFAALFGAWSLLIHEDPGQNGPPPEALEELRNAEAAIDSLRAELRWIGRPERVALSQINIDGPLIEWTRRESRHRGK